MSNRISDYVTSLHSGGKSPPVSADTPASRGFAQIFALHPSAAVLAIIVDLMVFGGDARHALRHVGDVERIGLTGHIAPYSAKVFVCHPLNRSPRTSQEFPWREHAACVIDPILERHADRE